MTQRRIEGRTFLIGELLGLFEFIWEALLLTNCDTTISWNEVFPDVFSRSQPNLKMVKTSDYTDSPK